MSHQHVSSKYLIKVPNQMSHPNVSSKCFIKMSHQNISSKYLIIMSHQGSHKVSHQNVSSKYLIKCLITMSHLNVFKCLIKMSHQNFSSKCFIHHPSSIIHHPLSFIHHSSSIQVWITWVFSNAIVISELSPLWQTNERTTKQTTKRTTMQIWSFPDFSKMVLIWFNLEFSNLPWELWPGAGAHSTLCGRAVDEWGPEG